MQRIIKQYKKEHPWLNCDKINFQYRKYKKDPSRSDGSTIVTGNYNNSCEQQDHEVGSKDSRFKGRPKGTTKASKFF